METFVAARKAEERRGGLFGLEARVLEIVGFGLGLERETWVDRESVGEAGGDGLKKSFDDDGAPIAEAMNCREISGGEDDRKKGRRQLRKGISVREGEFWDQSRAL